MQAIVIDHFLTAPEETSAHAMAALTGTSFPISDRVPDVSGEAFDFHKWFEAWLEVQKLDSSKAIPTHLFVEAADTFEASIPWNQLEGAAFLYSQGGEALAKGGPIRLYVPDGSSKCLNVKSIVRIKLVRLQQTEHDQASYGFKHTFSADDLRKNKGS